MRAVARRVLRTSRLNNHVEWKNMGRAPCMLYARGAIAPRLLGINIGSSCLDNLGRESRVTGRAVARHWRDAPGATCDVSACPRPRMRPRLPPAYSKTLHEGPPPRDFNFALGLNRFLSCSSTRSSTRWDSLCKWIWCSNLKSCVSALLTNERDIVIYDITLHKHTNNVN